MMIILTLILSLTTGFEASSEEREVKGCLGGWVEFTCKYPERNKNYQRITVSAGQNQRISTQKDVWEDKDIFYLFHNTKEQKLRVAIRQFHKMNATKYECRFEHNNTLRSVKVELEEEEDGCQKPLNQIAYRTAKTTITCKNPGDEFKASVKFFCKETKTSVCEDILPTKKNGTFTLINTRDDFNLIISNLTTQHAGGYWCGVESSGRHRATIRKINLQVKDIRNFTRFLTAGQNYSYWCEYKTAPIKFKFICKGDDPSICQPLTTTMKTINTNKFYMKDDLVKNITINVTDVTTDDTGTYWCGSESTDPSRNRTFYHMFLMIVELPHTSTPSVKSSSSSYPPAATSPVSPVTVSDDSQNGSWVSTIVAVCAVVLLLLLVLILVLAYKRFMSSKNRGNGAAVNRDKEDCCIYEEIAELPQKQESGTAMNSIYVTANFPTNPFAPLHYSTISFPNSPNEADDGTQKTNPSACDYSTVNYTANHPSRSAEEPLYHTVNKSQQL